MMVRLERRVLQLTALLVVAGIGVAKAEDDPFVAGAQMAWLQWAAGACNGQADARMLSRLQVAGNHGPELFADGQRAARRSIEQSSNAGETAMLCRVVIRDYGPDGRQLKGAFVVRGQQPQPGGGGVTGAPVRP